MYVYIYTVCTVYINIQWTILMNISMYHNTPISSPSQTMDHSKLKSLAVLPATSHDISPSNMVGDTPVISHCPRLQLKTIENCNLPACVLVVSIISIYVPLHPMKTMIITSHMLWCDAMTCYSTPKHIPTVLDTCTVVELVKSSSCLVFFDYVSRSFLATQRLQAPIFLATSQPLKKPKLQRSKRPSPVGLVQSEEKNAIGSVHHLTQILSDVPATWRAMDFSWKMHVLQYIIPIYITCIYIYMYLECSSSIVFVYLI